MYNVCYYVNTVCTPHYSTLLLFTNVNTVQYVFYSTTLFLNCTLLCKYCTVHFTVFSLLKDCTCYWRKYCTVHFLTLHYFYCTFNCINTVPYTLLSFHCVNTEQYITVHCCFYWSIFLQYIIFYFTIVAFYFLLA